MVIRVYDLAQNGPQTWPHSHRETDRERNRNKNGNKREGEKRRSALVLRLTSVCVTDALPLNPKDHVVCAKSRTRLWQIPAFGRSVTDVWCVPEKTTGHHAWCCVHLVASERVLVIVRTLIGTT